MGGSEPVLRKSLGYEGNIQPQTEPVKFETSEMAHLHREGSKFNTVENQQSGLLTVEERNYLEQSLNRIVNLGVKPLTKHFQEAVAFIARFTRCHLTKPERSQSWRVKQEKCAHVWICMD
ncbi:hypothetical protein NDU88_010810 [Pleurodeles waltl]|uniref:BH3-interacting domain death agonist n=1 Tax=Pleurodeles waltl TaxID=8319 RepID=A0AAV7QYL7_PLEWA|nr:hypothetical protein NDU88_010810 [Pleurodeles waltl]